jgi:D-sedoheptulose 7-phosphate isomerase
VISALEGSVSTIKAMADRVIACLAGGGCVFWAGNGGSAADSQHLASELVGRFERDRRAIASVALTTDTSALTAIGNDLGFDQVFARQVEALGGAGDLLVAISTSGTSANILRAAEAARGKGMAVIGLGGRDGGELKAKADICLVVPSWNTARIQEAHILVGHILCDLVERHFSAADAEMRSKP